ncbi:MAG: response regulator transcription factor [Ardenticatenaceae bacterium]|nr:response regulator transcription factor [Ardenticatenaceae bacterium]MCB9445822.1 response regulator transcription factor [Ardenticatenaceae bacterium]
MKTILVVDDEPEIIRVTRGYLEQAGFRVLTASNGIIALHTFRADKPDLVILDINLPTPEGSPPLDGLDVARAIRQTPGTAAATPIILLTARVDEIDRILGLELGADDYVTKPFSPRELVARVRAVLRRGRLLDEEPERIQVGDLVIDTAAYSVTRDNEAIELTPTEFTLLQNLAAAPGRVFSREQLLDTLGPDYEGLARTIDSHIKNLRAKIEPDPRRPELILTVFGRGYKFNEQQ